MADNTTPQRGIRLSLSYGRREKRDRSHIGKMGVFAGR